MAREIESREQVFFGEFELDCRTGELRRNGTTLKFQPQPAKVLAVLVLRAGEIVTREELAQQVWGSDTYVDFEHGLNFAIRKIRTVLEDDADNPVYLETIPKRGYRFVAPVTGNAHLLDAASVKERQFSRKTVAGLLTLAVASGVLTWFWHYRHQPNLAGERAPIVLGEFVNRTGDSVFNQTLREGLSVQLEQSPFLRFISDDQINDTLRMMGRTVDVELSPKIASEVCVRNNATITFAGSIDLIGTRYTLNLRAIDCDNGEVLASTHAEAADKSTVLDALGRLASDIRGKLGEPLSSVRRFNVPLARVTTPSLEALQCYSEGIRVLSKNFDYAASLSWFQKATELDSKFAMAYWAIGDVYAVLGETTSAVQYTRKAFELREPVSEREKALIEANYYYYVFGDVEKARHACEFLGRLYPFSEDAHNSVAVFAETLGQYDVGLTEYMEALRLAPRRSFLYRDVAYTYLALDRVDDASAMLQRAHRLDLDANLATVMYSIAFYRNDRNEMTRQVADAAGKTEIEDLLLALHADTLAYFGELSKARTLSNRAAELAKRSGKSETRALYYASSAIREALMGQRYKVQEEADIANKFPTGRDVKYGVALAYLYSGDLQRGDSATRELANRFPQDTVVKCNYLPTLNAKLALMRSNPRQAIETLTSAESCELGLPAYSYYNWQNLYPAYVRGEAYLAAHRDAEAVAEFEKIVAHRGIVLNEPIGALAHLQLGRSYAASGDLEKARSAYKEFLALWKDADPELPIYTQAKAEYANLRYLGLPDGKGKP